MDDCVGSFVGDVDFVSVPNSGRSFEITETEVRALDGKSWICTCSLLDRGDGPELGFLAHGRVRGVEVNLGPTSFGAAEIRILLCGAADEVVAPLEGAPSVLHERVDKKLSILHRPVTSESACIGVYRFDHKLNFKPHLGIPHLA